MAQECLETPSASGYKIFMYCFDILERVFLLFVGGLWNKRILVHIPCWFHIQSSSIELTAGIFAFSTGLRAPSRNSLAFPSSPASSPFLPCVFDLGKKFAATFSFENFHTVIVRTRGFLGFEFAFPRCHWFDFCPVPAQKDPITGGGFHGKFHDRDLGSFYRAATFENIAGPASRIPRIGSYLERLVPDRGTFVKGLDIEHSREPIGTWSNHGDRRHAIEPRCHSNRIQDLRFLVIVELNRTLHEFSDTISLLGVFQFLRKLNGGSSLRTTVKARHENMKWQNGKLKNDRWVGVPFVLGSVQ